MFVNPSDLHGLLPIDHRLGRGELIKQAKRSITLIDNYIDETTLTMLSKRDANVSATIYTRQLSNQQQLDVQRHNQQYPPIIVNICQRNHDRFLIIDDMVYLFGASLKDAGKFSFNSPNCLYTKKS